MIISISQEMLQNNSINDEEAEIPATDVERRMFPVPMHQHRARVDRVLAELVPELSRSYLQKLIQDQAVEVNQQCVVKPSQKVLAGDRLQVELRPTPDALAFMPEEMSLEIVYEDDALLVVNKPAGLVVHPGAGNWSGTLLNGLLAHTEKAKFLPRAGIVHRLDKDTSGLLVVAKTLEAYHGLVQLFATRDISRKYIALVKGAWEQEYRKQDREIVDPIGRDSRSKIRMAVRHDGKEAKTKIHFLAENDGYSLVECALFTGRTHQIRVHLSHIQHPLVGDGLYGGPILGEMNRQALHAFQLDFRHPISGESLIFKEKCPDDLLNVVKFAGIDISTL